MMDRSSNAEAALAAALEKHQLRQVRQQQERAANCYDNAFLESCFGTIKTELEMTEYQDCRQARSEIASYLAYYNAERRHSSLDYISPIAFEAQLPVPR